MKGNYLYGFSVCIKVLFYKKQAVEGSNVMSINTATLTKGVYIFELQNGTEANRQKFSVSK